MQLALDQVMGHGIGMEVSPALVTFTELLMLPTVAMSAAIEDELAANPALERLETGECPVCRGHGRCPLCDPPRPRAAAADPGVAAPESSGRQTLAQEVRLVSRDPDVAELVVHSLDEHGMLDRSPSALAADLHVSTARVLHALEDLRAVGPPGVGAACAAECLLLQLDALGLADRQAGLARVVIAEHLPALARGHRAAIAAALGVPRAAVDEVLCLLRSRLRPYPAFDGGAARVSYVVPDIVIRESADGFSVHLVEPAHHRLRVRTRGDEPAASRRSAAAFLEQVHERWRTLRAVAEYVVAWQHRYLRDGPELLRPLTRAQVADAIGAHESTVSRTVAQKFALLPGGELVPLSEFFGASGGLDETLRRLVDSASGPLSDARLAELLRGAGYDVARRTVAKHRARLGIPPVALR